MESGAHKLLESATQRTLHAHAFSRSSSQASLVLTDLLSRYLSLLTATCAKYARHSGRTNLTVRDALASLEELGVTLEELDDYCSTEGKELNRYALYSARRVEDLQEFKSQLADGLRQDRDDAIPLEYMRCPTPLLEELDSGDEQDSEEDGEGETDGGSHPEDHQLTNGMDVDDPLVAISALPRKRPPSRPTTPPLPLSPVSNPSSPRRKRPRRTGWEPPAHIPNFLPPFPSVSDDTPPSPVDHDSTLQSQAMMPPGHIAEAAAEKTAATLSQSLTTAAASDFLVQVEQSLLQAYHYILTHPPPRELPPLNPSRHKVAMALMHDSQTNPRWTTADSLFATVAPCPPRVATIGPSYPVAIGDVPGEKGKDGKDKEPKLPQTIPRPVSGPEDWLLRFPVNFYLIILTCTLSQPAILARTSRLSHPPILYRGTKPLIYGSGIPAPWNANAISVGGDAVPATPATSKPKDAPGANGKDSPEKPILPDARLFATWDYDTKDFKAPLAPRGRARMGSMQASGSGVISLPMSSRSKGLK
ncbi:hypothetical protein NLJ89_g3678 [Agrocybe chaxingu]|uniref:Bromodomain associated domain-containing protein n=1 Tax=Agrocybe chaxingu TaxID=84603 RepID=A0A9W8K212_9AGAR|nr:hypothetical protein NLJ89_g3678 [Agrocybe chaxingu]